MIKQYLQKNISKFWFWFVMGVAIISWGSLFFPGDRCNPSLWFNAAEGIHFFTFPLFLFFILPLTLVLIILSFFIDLRLKILLGIALVAGIMGLGASFGVNYIPGRCPDDFRIADLYQIQTAEKLYFEKYNRYGTYEELEQSHIMPIIPRIYKGSGEFYPFILSADKQSFEVKTKLDRGTWAICNKDKCEEYEEK